MIKEQDILQAGKFLKPHGLDGELNVLTEYNSEILENGYPLIVDLDGIYVPFYTSGVRTKGEFSSLVSIDGVDCVEEARKFVNKLFYMLKKDIAEYLDVDEDELIFDEDFIGYEVEDAKLGRIGVVKDIDDSTENVLLIVDPNNGGEEIYIPFVDEFIHHIDEADEDGKGKIVMQLPEGLLNM